MAKLEIDNLSSDPRDLGLSITRQIVLIDWAKNKRGYRCKIDRVWPEHLSGDAYQSCIYWSDGRPFHHYFFSVWGEEETIDFINNNLKLLNN